MDMCHLCEKRLKGENKMREYFRMKKYEWKVKAQFFGIIASFMENRKGITDLLKKLYEAFKDTDSEELKEMLVTKIVELSRGAE